MNRDRDDEEAILARLDAELGSVVPVMVDNFLQGSYPEGDYVRRVRELGAVDRFAYDALVAEYPFVGGALWQAEAEAATVLPGGWRADKPDFCRTVCMNMPVGAVCDYLHFPWDPAAPGRRWVIPEPVDRPIGTAVAFKILAQIWDELPPCRGSTCDGCSGAVPWWFALAGRS
jgi:hypothetical protein